MPKSTKFKKVVVREDAKTSLRAAKIHPLTLKHGQKIVAAAHLYFPYHDRSMFETWLKFLEEQKPAVVLLLGGIVSEDAFKALWEDEDNYLHDYPEVPEVQEAKEAGLFEDRVMTLANRIREELFVRIAKASGATVIWDPSWTHLSMANEVRTVEWIQSTKRFLDGWTQNHPDSPDILSDPSVRIPRELDQLFGLKGMDGKDGRAHIKVLRYGAGVKVNDSLLFMIGDFRRRNAGDASQVEWEQRGTSIVRSFDGKVASWWMTTPDHSLPGLRLKFWQGHEIGYMWDPIQNAHFRDYDRRAAGFWWGRIRFGKVEGRSIPFRRGGDGRRSFVVNGKAYTEAEPGCTWCGEEITLAASEHAHAADCGCAHASDAAVLGTPEAISYRPETDPAVLGTPEGMSSRKADEVVTAEETPAVLGTPEAISSRPAKKAKARKSSSKRSTRAANKKK